jgi:hypothetical protein
VISKVLITFCLAALSVGAFASEATWADKSDDHVFIVLGVLAGALALVSWFRWETIHEGWTYDGGSSGEGAKLPLLAWSWPIYISSIYNLRRPFDRQRPGSQR